MISNLVVKKKVRNIYEIKFGSLPPLPSYVWIEIYGEDLSRTKKHSGKNITN